jgi:hypothetical protein
MTAQPGVRGARLPSSRLAFLIRFLSFLDCSLSDPYNSFKLTAKQISESSRPTQLDDKPGVG